MLQKLKSAIRTNAKRSAASGAQRLIQSVVIDEDTSRENVRNEDNGDDECYVVEDDGSPAHKKVRLSASKTYGNRTRMNKASGDNEDDSIGLYMECCVEDLSNVQKTFTSRANRESHLIDQHIQRLVHAEEASVIQEEEREVTTLIQVIDMVHSMTSSQRKRSSSHTVEQDWPLVTNDDHNIEQQSVINHQLSFGNTGGNRLQQMLTDTNRTIHTPKIKVKSVAAVNKLSTEKSPVHRVRGAAEAARFLQEAPPPQPQPQLPSLTVRPQTAMLAKSKPPTNTIRSSGADLKLQGSTYPSLVVVARPMLNNQNSSVDRARLDTKVKNVLMYSPAKFTEWLLQRGLIRPEQKCRHHPFNTMKLGMFSDTMKFPHSGGYVWISDCCPTEYTQVFNGSLFEKLQQTPQAILKLLYHWSCQTTVQNVTQWVKVDNTTVKQIYTYLRGVCTISVHTHTKLLGGPGIKVQIGVISLGASTTSLKNTSQSAPGKQAKIVKLEVLGIMELPSKVIRLRAIKPISTFERNFRAFKVLAPLVHWVHPSSTIIADVTIDKNTLHSLGFLHVVQLNNLGSSSVNSNITTYMRSAIPKMFQSTLPHLSHQIIQQFLDELAWREQFASTVLMCYDNVLKHLAEQTKYYLNKSVRTVLNEVTADPFKNWALLIGTEKRSSGNCATLNIANIAPLNDNSKTTMPPPQLGVLRRRGNRGTKHITLPEKESQHDVDDAHKQLVPLEAYYYGTIKPKGVTKTPSVAFTISCSFCKLTFVDNISLMEHLFQHAHNTGSTLNSVLCRYCLASAANWSDLRKHIDTCHPYKTRFDNSFLCLICEMRFMTLFILGKHMCREHCQLELPYMCGSCTFRCSVHKQAVDHFYQAHCNSNTIQCPFCLKTMTVYANGKGIPQILHCFVHHLQKHQRNAMAKKCHKCNLWFVQKDVMKEHTAKMHLSQRGRRGVLPYVASTRNCVLVPKTTGVDDEGTVNPPLMKYGSDRTLLCKECSRSLVTPKHFTSYEQCKRVNCQYGTFCGAAMKKHQVLCQYNGSADSIAIERLPYYLYCICGYKDRNGNVLARHLATCEKKSVYASEEAAKQAIVKHSMLDVLGLVRRCDEKSADDLTEAKEEISTNDSNDITNDHQIGTETCDLTLPIDNEVDKE